jgi:hypothetical protein
LLLYLRWPFVAFQSYADNLAPGPLEIASFTSATCKPANSFDPRGYDGASSRFVFRFACVLPMAVHYV